MTHSEHQLGHETENLFLIICEFSPQFFPYVVSAERCNLVANVFLVVHSLSDFAWEMGYCYQPRLNKPSSPADKRPDIALSWCPWCHRRMHPPEKSGSTQQRCQSLVLIFTDIGAMRSTKPWPDCSRHFSSLTPLYFFSDDYLQNELAEGRNLETGGYRQG